MDVLFLVLFAIIVPLAPLAFVAYLAVTMMRAPRERARASEQLAEEWRARSARLGLAFAPAGPPGESLFRREMNHNLTRRAQGFPDDHETTRVMVRRMAWAAERAPGLEGTVDGRTFRVAPAEDEAEMGAPLRVILPIPERGLVLRALRPGLGDGDYARIPTGDPALDERAALLSPQPDLARRLAPAARGLLERVAADGIELWLGGGRAVVSLPGSRVDDGAYIRGVASDLTRLAAAIEALPEPPAPVAGPPLPTSGLGLWAPRIATPTGRVDMPRLVLALLPAVWPVLGIAFLGWAFSASAIALWGTFLGYFTVSLLASPWMPGFDLRRTWIAYPIFASLILAFGWVVVAGAGGDLSTLRSMDGFLLPAGLGFALAFVPRSWSGRPAEMVRGLGREASLAMSAYFVLFTLSIMLSAVTGAPFAVAVWLLATAAHLAIGIGLVRPEAATAAP